MKTLAERLSYLMDTKGMNGAELAVATSVNVSTVSRVLKGTQTPGSDTLYRFAQFFNTSMEYLLTGEEATSNNCVNANYSPEEFQLIKYYHTMSPNDQEDLLLIAEMKANKGKRKIKSSPSNTDNTEFETA